MTGTQSELLRFTVSALTGGDRFPGGSHRAAGCAKNGLVALGKGGGSGYHYRQRQGLYQWA